MDMNHVKRSPLGHHQHDFKKSSYVVECILLNTGVKLVGFIACLISRLRITTVFQSRSIHQICNQITDF